MATRNRIKGENITFIVDGVEYKEDATSIVLSHEEADDDVVTFGDTDGAYEWRLTVSAIQSTDADSLHTFFYENAGSTVDFVFGPHGNATPTAAQPHFTGTLNLSNKKPNISVEGAVGGSTQTFEMEVTVDGEVTRVISGGA